MSRNARRIDRRTVLRGAAGTAGAVALGLANAPRAGATGGAESGSRLVRSQDKPTEIVFSHIWGTPPGEQATEKKHPVELLIDAFNAKGTGVKVISRTESVDYFEMMQKAQAQIAAGQPPALMATPWAFIHFATEGLAITPLETIAGDELQGVMTNYKEEVLPLVQLGDQTLGVPFAFSVPVIYYNNDIMKSAGVDPAALFRDWTSFREMGQAVKNTTGNPILGLNTNADWPAQSIIQCNGGQVMTEDGKPVMDSPEAITAMQAIADVHRDGLYLFSTPAEARSALIGGSLPCMMASIAALGGLRASVTFDLQTTPFPVFEGKPRKMSSGGSFIGCYARDEDQQQGAWEFLKFVASQEGMDIWMQTGYLNATKYEIPVLPGQEAAYTELNEGITRETPWPGARGAEASKVWRTFVERIWSNDMSADEGCKQAKAEIEPLLPRS